METLIKPPHSLEAEREVLSVVLIEPESIATLIGSLRDDDFYSQRHQFVFVAMRELYERKSAIDLMTLMQVMKDRGTFEKAGGIQTLSELLDRVGCVEHLQHYIAIVLDKARLRRVLNVVRSVETEALGDVDSVDAFVERLGQQFQHTIDDVAPRRVLDLRTLAERKKQDRNDDWLDGPPPAANVLLRVDGAPFMRDSTVAMLNALGGTGKSYVLADFALSIASGADWLGACRVERRGKVVLAFAEEEQDEIRRRLWQLARKLDAYHRAKAEDYIIPLGLRGQDVSFLRRGKDGNVVKTAWFESFRSSLSAMGPLRAIVLDPLSRWGGPEVESDPYVATQAVQCCEELTKIDGQPAVLLAHHSRKTSNDGAPGRRPRDASNVRGSSALVDASRLVMEMTRRPDSNLVDLEVTKANYTVASRVTLARMESGALRPATHDEIDAYEADRKTRREA